MTSLQTGLQNKHSNIPQNGQSHYPASAAISSDFSARHFSLVHFYKRTQIYHYHHSRKRLH